MDTTNVDMTLNLGTAAYMAPELSNIANFAADFGFEFPSPNPCVARPCPNEPTMRNTSDTNEDVELAKAGEVDALVSRHEQSPAADLSVVKTPPRRRRSSAVDMRSRSSSGNTGNTDTSVSSARSMVIERDLATKVSLLLPTYCV